MSCHGWQHILKFLASIVMAPSAFPKKNKTEFSSNEAVRIILTQHTMPSVIFRLPRIIRSMRLTSHEKCLAVCGEGLDGQMLDQQHSPRPAQNWGSMSVTFHEKCFTFHVIMKSRQSNDKLTKMAWSMQYP